MNIFDAMLEMREHAIEHGRTPRRWELNAAGIDALRRDGRVAEADQPGATEAWIGRKMLGIPMTRLPTRWFDSAPVVELIVDEEGPSR